MKSFQVVKDEIHSHHSDETSLKVEFKPKAEILLRFAKAFYEMSSLKKTHLHLASKLRWDLFVRYLKWLQNNNYVKCIVNRNAKIYELTLNGKQMFNSLIEFFEYIL